MPELAMQVKATFKWTNDLGLKLKRNDLLRHINEWDEQARKLIVSAEEAMQALQVHLATLGKGQSFTMDYELPKYDLKKMVANVAMGTREHALYYVET